MQMDHICSSPYNRILVVCSAASIQEKLAKYLRQPNSSISGFYITVDALQFRDSRRVDSADSVYWSATTNVFCCICNLQTPFLIGNSSEMPAKVKRHLSIHMSTSHVLQRNREKDRDDGSETDNLQTVSVYQYSFQCSFNCPINTLLLQHQGILLSLWVCLHTNQMS